MELTQQLAYAQEQLKQGMGDPQQMNQIRQQINDIQAEMNHIQQPLGPYFFSMMIWMLLGFGISAAITGIVRAKQTS
jgi:small-conductance mechanosensitive channel